MPFFHHHHNDRDGGPRQSAPSLPPPSKPSTDYVVLDPAGVQLRREGQRLQLRQDAEGEWAEVTLVRLFPLSDPQGWLSVLDSKGNEVGIVLGLDALPKDQRSAAQEELDRRYLVPQILRILGVRDRGELVVWSVETDRGPTEFMTRHLREQVKEAMPTRLALVDVEGNRYDVPEIADLDAESRRLLETRI